METPKKLTPQLIERKLAAADKAKAYATKQQLAQIERRLEESKRALELKIDQAAAVFEQWNAMGHRWNKLCDDVEALYPTYGEVEPVYFKRQALIDVAAFKARWEQIL
jgi:hypothetical protein